MNREEFGEPELVGTPEQVAAAVAGEAPPPGPPAAVAPDDDPQHRAMPPAVPSQEDFALVDRVRALESWALNVTTLMHRMHGVNLEPPRPVASGQHYLDGVAVPPPKEAA